MEVYWREERKRDDSGKRESEEPDKAQSLVSQVENSGDKLSK